MRFQQGEGRTGGDGERTLAMLRAQICRHDAVQLTLHATTHAIAGVHPIMTVTMTVMVMVMTGTVAVEVHVNCGATPRAVIRSRSCTGDQTKTLSARRSSQRRRGDPHGGGGV